MLSYHWYIVLMYNMWTFVAPVIDIEQPVEYQVDSEWYIDVMQWPRVVSQRVIDID